MAGSRQRGEAQRRCEVRERGSPWLRVPSADELPTPGLLLRALAPLLLSRDARTLHPTAEDPAYFEWEARTARGVFAYYRRYLPSSRQRILDVAAGPGGRTASYAAESPHLFVALDRDAGLLGRAAARGQGPAGERVLAVVGNAAALPFPEERFDACLCENALEHFERPDLVICEMQRVVRRGGLLFILFPPWRGPTAGHLSDLTWLPWVHLLPRLLFLRLLAALARARDANRWQERAHARAMSLSVQLNGWPLRRLLETFDHCAELHLLGAYVLGYGRVGRFLRFLPIVGEFFASAIYLVFRRTNPRPPGSRHYRTLLRLTVAGRDPASGSSRVG